MTNNPYLLDLPAVVSFSGGRTSGFLLRKTLDAHGGQPEGLKVCFQNTGLEHAATYDFVDACAKNWEVDITWLELTHHPERRDESKPYHGRGSGMGEEFGFRIVSYETASRNGEPFTAMANRLPALPNPVTRTCTAYLKIRTEGKYLRSLPEFSDGYTKAVGLRADEPRRVHRVKPARKLEDINCPMYTAGHTEEDVLAFWRDQPFDLGLPLEGNMAGNCVGCFLKGRGKLDTLMAEMPEYFEWWANIEGATEERVGPEHPRSARFRLDRPSYANWAESIRKQGALFPASDEDTIPCMCTD